MTTREYLEHKKKYYNQQEGQRYPCSNQIVTRILFCKQLDDKVFNYIESINGKWKILNKEFILPNGELYKVLKASDHIRGYRAYKAIVDDRIFFDIIKTIVIPMCANYCCSFEIF